MSKTSENENKKRSRQTFYEEPLAPEEIKSLGEQAASLMAAPVFNMAWRAMVQDVQDEWLATEPKEREKRESLHAEVRAAGRMLNSLTLRYEAAQRVSEDETRTDNELLFEYDENSGFPGHESERSS